MRVAYETMLAEFERVLNKASLLFLSESEKPHKISSK